MVHWSKLVGVILWKETVQDRVLKPLFIVVPGTSKESGGPIVVGTVNTYSYHKDYNLNRQDKGQEQGLSNTRKKL